MTGTISGAATLSRKRPRYGGEPANNDTRNNIPNDGMPPLVSIPAHLQRPQTWNQYGHVSSEPQTPRIPTMPPPAVPNSISTNGFDPLAFTGRHNSTPSVRSHSSPWRPQPIVGSINSHENITTRVTSQAPVEGAIAENRGLDSASQRSPICVEGNANLPNYGVHQLPSVITTTTEVPESPRRDVPDAFATLSLQVGQMYDALCAVQLKLREGADKDRRMRNKLRNIRIMTLGDSSAEEDPPVKEVERRPNGATTVSQEPRGFEQGIQPVFASLPFQVGQLYEALRTADAELWKREQRVRRIKMQLDRIRRMTSDNFGSEDEEPNTEGYIGRGSPEL